jgi:hypothetical protein
VATLQGEPGDPLTRGRGPELGLLDAHPAPGPLDGPSLQHARLGEPIDLLA